MKKLILPLPCLFIAIIAAAQFGPLNDISRSTFRPRDVKSFDLDGDGDMDILSTSEFDNKIAWYENEGNGTFGSQKIVSTDIGYAQSAYAGDLDGDGDMDVVTAAKYDSKVTWYENEGSGIFGPEQNISANAVGAQSVYVVDLDGDGDNDVLAGSSSNGRVAWYENEGGGSFATEQIISTNSYNSVFIYAADLDGDGDMDVLSASEDNSGGDANTNQIDWSENLGDGNFGALQIITTQVIEAKSVYAADLDGDGDQDVLSASNNKLAWYENDGGGNFGSQDVLSANADMAESVYAADLDGDGDLDVLSACGNFGNSDKIAWYENQGGGYFGPEQIISSAADLAQSVYAADLDGDGDMDVLSASLFDNKIAWYENDGTATFGSQQLISIEAAGALSVYAADMDGDGDVDVLSASFNDNKIAWYENEGGGIFGPQRIISTNAIEANTVCAADLDGDGDLDVLSASGGDDKIAWYENEGADDFGTEQIISIEADNANSVYAADLDGDGDMDVISTSFDDDNVVWYENEGSGSFGSQQIISSETGGASAVYAADLDGDGDMDLLSASWNNINLAWYENMDNGSFGPQQIISNDANVAMSIYAADLDEDGDLDVLLSSGLSEGKIVWFENDGGGNFSTQQTISNNSNPPTSVYAADLDGDGDLDVLSAFRFINVNGGIAWFENNGDGNFGMRQNISINGVDGESVYAADMDGDGDMDVLSASQYFFDGKIAWFENHFYGATQISGRLFFDSNQNGLYDSLDIGFNQIGLFSNPQSDYSYTSPNGNYFINFSDTIGSYQIFPQMYPGWTITTDSLNYTISVDSLFTSLDSLDFGFYPDSTFTDVQPALTSGFPRCNERINYWLNIHNLGTSLPSGIIHLQLADSINYISSAIEPDSIIGQNIYWHFDSLFYFSATSINLEVQMPPFTSMGDTLSSVLTVHELDEENNIVYSNSDTLSQISVCAYDPNDKSVNPAGVGEEGYIAQNQELEYLIRFQNTGNDTAITVVIRDQLHENLDWSSLHPIASSHTMQVHVQQTGEAVFTFENIMLPDSNVNVLASQGFVKFSVMPDEGLLPNTPILNTANIYFDQNPAVVTNTLHNTIECYNTPQPVISFTFTYLSAGVSGDFTYQWFYNGEEIPGAISDTLTPIGNGIYTVSIEDIYNCEKVSDEYLYSNVGIDESEQIKAVVYPNPFSESTTIVFEQNLNGEYDLLVNNVHGKQVKRINKIEGNTVTLHKFELGKGVFLCYVVNNQTGEKVFIEKLIIQ